MEPTIEQMTHPKFVEWANKKGINLESREDWEPWWDCWHNGFAVCSRQYVEALINAGAKIKIVGVDND